jgi:hypothetical protein
MEVQMLFEKLWRMVIVIAVVGIATIAYGIDKREAAYVGNNATIGGINCAWAFISRFSYEQYYYAQSYMFREYNNWFVDDCDMVYHTSHGLPYYIFDYNENDINLGGAGNTSHQGYGDAGTGCKFLILHSCSTVPSSRDRSDWWQPWVNPNSSDIFDGLHQVLGFRSTCYGSSSSGVSGYFADKVKNGGTIWQSWFEAINKKGATEWVFWPFKKKVIEFGCAVMDPAAQNDTYGSWCATPSSTSASLYHWYQY